MHVHIVHQVGHLWHVLDDLVWLSGSISLRDGKNNSKRKIVLNPECGVKGMTMKNYTRLVCSRGELLI